MIYFIKKYLSSGQATSVSEHRDANGVALTDQLTASNQRTTSVAAKQMVETFTLNGSLSPALEGSLSAGGTRKLRGGAERRRASLTRHETVTAHGTRISFAS